MSNTATSANVIPMRDFDRPVPTQQAAQFDRLLKECQTLATERLQKSVAVMLDKVEDTLWGLANNAQDRETRDLYIAAKEKALDQRRTIEEQFRARYLGEFETRTASRGKKDADDFSRYDLSSLELNLVAEDDLDETLKISEMAGKLRRYCDDELAALDQRVGVLIGDANLQGEGNPFSPQAICGAYKQAIRHVESNLKVRLVFHKLFDDHVLDDIRSIYKDLNALLVQRSILPKIRYGVRRTGIGPRLPIPGAVPGAVELGQAAMSAGPLAAAAPVVDAYIAAGLGDGIAAGGAEQDFFAVLQNLIGLGGGIPRAGAGRQSQVASGTLMAGAPLAAGAVPVASAPGAPAGAPLVQVPGFPAILGGAAGAGLPAAPMLQGAELVGSLTRIQHGDVSAVAAGNLPLAATLVEPGTTNVLRELKGTALGTGLGQMDSMTLDIVTMLFDQIFDDGKIPGAMKGLIGRLQIPMLKVAILDKTFFSKKTHPARKLLDTLGEVALGLGADFDPSSPLHGRLEDVVQRLIDGFQTDLDIFDRLREELEEMLAEANRRAEEEARAMAQRIEQKEKLALAKAMAQQEIKHRAQTHRIPGAVLKFLAGQWVKLLLVAHAKHGPDSEAYKSAVATMDLLIWSVTPMQALEERRTLASRLPGLLKRINYGMQLVGTDEATRRAFFAKLMRCHTKVINGGAATAAATATRAPTAPPAEASDAAPPTLTEVVSSLDSGHGAQPHASHAPAVHDADTEPAEAPPEFAAVTVNNPFGDGDIEVEEISLSDIPGAPSPLPGESSGSGGDEYSRMASSLREGTWVEFRDDEDLRKPARLSYISPLKGTYLFVNRQGRKVGEYSLYQLAREFRSGGAVILDEVPLFDRAMTSLVGVLKGAGAVH